MMPIAIWFWILLAIWCLFGFWGGPPEGHPARRVYHWGEPLVLLVLLFLIGLKLFGSPITG
jgi:hypothetical protein